MFVVTWIVSLGAILKDYAQGLTKSEIIARRSEWMLTVWMTVLIMTGFKPLLQSLSYLWELILVKPLGWIFKKKKVRYLNKLLDFQEERIAQLMKEKEKSEQDLHDLLNKNPQLKHALEAKRTIPEEPSTSLEKEGDDNNE